MKAISLFSGAGLSSQGLIEAGYEIVTCVENDPNAVRTLTNLGRYVVSEDVKEIDWADLRRKTGDIDLLEGGPPCQPFSQAGKGVGSSDKRDCIPDFAAAVQAYMPRMFIMENVRALTFKSHRAYLEEVLDWFPEEYTVDWRVLNAADYGVPQTRQRLFIVGRLDGAPRWPEPTHGKMGSKGAEGRLPWVSMASALGWDTPRIVANEHEGDCRWRVGTQAEGLKLRHNAAERDRPRDAEGKQRAFGPNGEDYYLRFPVDAVAPTISTQAGGWAWERPATTVVGSFSPETIAAPGYRTTGGPSRQNAPGSVKVTPEEAAALQNFPPDWPFHGPKTAVFRQIGNACPRTFTRLIAAANLP